MNPGGESRSGDMNEKMLERHVCAPERNSKGMTSRASETGGEGTNGRKRSEERCIEKASYEEGGCGVVLEKAYRREKVEMGREEGMMDVV